MILRGVLIPWTNSPHVPEREVEGKKDARHFEEKKLVCFGQLMLFALLSLSTAVSPKLTEFRITYRIYVPGTIKCQNINLHNISKRLQYHEIHVLLRTKNSCEM